MKLLLKAALLNRRHYLLLFVTFVAMVFLTVASQMEMFTLGVMAKTGPDFFTLFGEKREEKIEPSKEVSRNRVEERWQEIAGSSSAPLTLADANAYLAKNKGLNLVQRVASYLDARLQLSTHLLRLALIVVVVALFKASSLFCYRYITQLVAIRVSRDLRQKYFEHIQSLPMSFYNVHNIGSLSARVSGDAGIVATATNSLLINYFQTPFALISTLLACIYISWQLSLVIFVGFPLIILPMVFIARKIKKISKLMQRNQEGFAQVLIDFLGGIQTVKIFAMEDFSLKKYREQNQQMAHLEERSARYGLASRPIMHTIASLFFAAVIIYGLYVVQIGVAELLVFCGLLYIFYEPIKKFAEENAHILRGIAAAERMYEVLHIEPTIQDLPGARELSYFEEGIEFDNVSFRYQEEWVLKNVSFKVKKGETVALVGPTGSGKSTIVQLLPRLYEVQKGEIRIDGRPLKEYTQRSIRERIAFVPQRPFLFLDTVHENIAFGRAFTPEKVLDAAKRAHAHEFIVDLPHKYSTMLSESGKNLSGGQQQRLAIARALVKEAPILVMDEATSSLDALSENKIKEALMALRGEMTQIIIAHRFSTIEHADKIIYLEQGRIVAMGTKEELLSTCSNFRAMWELMSTENIK